MPLQPSIPLRFLLSLLLLAACGQGDREGEDWSKGKREDYALPVRVATPGRGPVEDYVETQKTLESERRADIHAEVAGRIIRKVRDLGDRVGTTSNGADPLLLAQIDDTDLGLTLREAQIKHRQANGRIQELELEKKRTTRELEQARVTQAEADAMLARTTSGIQDGTINLEEHERATFARNMARSKVQAAQAALDKAEVALMLGSVAVEEASVAVERARVAKERATLTAPFAGVVTFCDLREGERVRVGDHLYSVEDPDTLIVYADIPVRQANRVREGNRVLVGSNAAPETTTGVVTLVAPTVDKASGTVQTKIRVAPKAGFRPGLFVTIRIVVAARADALTVPKRAVLHDDEQGPYLFVVEKDQARRVAVETGFEKDTNVEILEGVGEDAQVVVEGQDTLTDEAKVEIQER